MKKTKLINIVAIAFASTLLLSACGGGSDSNEFQETTSNESIDEGTTVDTDSNSDDNTGTDTDSSGLSSAEIQSLLFMREEEELARDLYLDIYETKDSRLNVFKNISDNAETKHAAAMLTLLNNYGIADPSTGQRNTYTNSELQDLYNQLLSDAIGSDDLAALRVGALVEETDIQDIVNDMTLISPQHQDILATYDNLLCGSRNHLRSFVKQIENTTGQPYQIQVPAIHSVIQEIVNSDQEQCGQ